MSTTQNSCTIGHLVFRMVGGELEIHGLLDSDGSASATIDILDRIMPEHEWQKRPVMFLGWGFKGIFTNNSGEIVKSGALQ